MRPTLKRLALFSLCCVPLLAAAQSATDSSKVLALEKQWTDAYRQRDITQLSSLLAEDFVITVEDGNTYGKEGYISHSADTTVHVDVAEQSELRSHMHGNVAVVSGAYHETGLSKGKRYEYHDRFTDVWIKSSGKWQVVASHYSVPQK